MLLTRLRSGARPVITVLALLMTIAPAAHAIDCDVHVHQAYETAKARGWSFQCVWGLPGAKATFMTFGDKVGCVLDTPHLPWLEGSDPTIRFFTKSSGKALKNGWSMKSFEVTGAQWEHRQSNTSLVAVRFRHLKQGTKYQTRLSRLTLTKNGGNCSKAINEAF